MKRAFPVNYETRLEQFQNGPCLGLPEKERRELSDTFDTLIIWRELFSKMYGELKEITHHSNPDDPPDAIATFERDALSIEHTLIEPPHVMQSAALHREIGNGRGHFLVPISGKYTKEEQEKIMYEPSGRGAWENVGDALCARANLIINAIKTKIEKYSEGGLLILSAQIFGNDHDKEMLEKSFKASAKIPGAERWMFALIYRWNNSACFSAFYSLESGFRALHLP